MARRVRSVPAGGNVFWSQKAQEELVLRMTRPRDLPEMPPVPGDDAETSRELHVGHGYPSFLCWPETDRILTAYDDVLHVRVDQGALGHKRKKPTTLVTNIPEIKMLNGLQDHSPQQPWPATLQGRLEESRSLSEWAPELKKLLVSVAVRIHRGQPPLRLRPTVPRLHA